VETEQPVKDSDIQDRMSSFFGGPPEVATDPEAEAPAEQTQAATDAEEGETPNEYEAEPADDLVEIELEDGEKYRVPPKLKDRVMADKDYTVKTQELAVQRKAVEDKAMFVEAREKLSEALNEDMAEVQRLEYQRKQYEGLDWSALYNADPGQAMKLRDQRDELAREIAQKTDTLQQKVRRGHEMLTQHADKQWEIAVEGAKQRIGKVSPAEDAAMLDQVRVLGFDASEIKSKLADSRILQAIHKAAKWDALQKAKPGAVQAAQKAPPILKSGPVNPNAQQNTREKALRQQVKKTGNINDVARLLASRIK
jgi:hypothetical protein